MSPTAKDRPAGAGVLAWARPALPLTRVLALAGLLALLASFLSMVHYIVAIEGDPSTFVAVVTGTLLAATVLARVLRERVALSLAGVLLAVGMVWYLGSLSTDPRVWELVWSNVELLSGQSILEIEASTVWALVVAPPPTFVTWYLGLRGWYGTATLVGGGTLGYFVLTGDADLPVTLLGVVGAAGAVGFGDLHSRETSDGALEAVAVVLAVMVVAPLVVSVVPGSVGLPFGGSGDAGDATTLEGSLIKADSEFEIQGAIELSPEVRFTVTSAERHYWRVDSYNRYTGDGWVRSGQPAPYEQTRLVTPAGDSRQLRQEFRVESTATVMPAAWRPVAVDGGVADETLVTTEFGLSTEQPLEPGDRYRVTSAVPEAPRAVLTAAGGDDPPDIEERYTQVPASTPDRVGQRAARIVAPADGRYEAVRRVEQWLEQNKEYSLDVDRPDGDVADSFLFEMDAGYCTYFATTMAVMLRTQGIPARMTVGYTPGEQVDPDRYVVRGYDSHAWVEVYFPETGWIRFDPTPSDSRQEAERERLETARDSGESNVDTDETDPDRTVVETPTPTPFDTPDRQVQGPTTTTPNANRTPDQTVSTPTRIADDIEEGDSGGLPDLPRADQLLLGVVVLAGAIAGARRSRLGRRAYRWVWLRYQPRADPPTDIERSHRRLLYVLEQRHRPRQAGETVRTYLDAIDAPPPAREIAELRERARYGNEATETMAEDARRLLDRVRRR